MGPLFSEIISTKVPTIKLTINLRYVCGLKASLENSVNVHLTGRISVEYSLKMFVGDFALIQSDSFL